MSIRLSNRQMRSFFSSEGNTCDLYSADIFLWNNDNTAMYSQVSCWVHNCLLFKILIMSLQQFLYIYLEKWQIQQNAYLHYCVLNCRFHILCKYMYIIQWYRCFVSNWENVKRWAWIFHIILYSSWLQEKSKILYQILQWVLLMILCRYYRGNFLRFIRNLQC